MPRKGTPPCVTPGGTVHIPYDGPRSHCNPFTHSAYLSLSVTLLLNPLPGLGILGYRLMEGIRKSDYSVKDMACHFPAQELTWLPIAQWIKFTFWLSGFPMSWLNRIVFFHLSPTHSPCATRLVSRPLPVSTGKASNIPKVCPIKHKVVLRAKGILGKHRV